ncbi:MAG TPA: hypothetical protein VNE16_11945 [Vicinamibacterales bacterium]|nr:hypothetical protein [Vicinamibacterales bacterium]
MSWSRIVALVAGAALLAAWFAAANSTRTRLPPAPAAVMAPDPELQAVRHLLQQTTRLSGAMQAMAAPRTPARNPFQFGSAASQDDVPATPPAGPRPAALAPPPAPSFELEGIATNRQAGRPVLTAIISGDGQLFLVKIGDQVTSRYRVAGLSAGEVVLDDSTGGPPLHLRLR